MTIIRHAALSLLALTFLSSSALADLPAPVIVVTGGYASCDRDASGNVSTFGGNFNAMGVQMINELHNHFSAPHINWRGMSEAGIRWIFTCFNTNSDMFIQSDRDAYVVQTGAWDINAIVSRIEDASNFYERPIFVIGHSHGGWLAMRVVEALRQPIPVGYLATLDPISFTECNTATFADALMMLVAGWPWDTWGYIAPCRQAPGDITPAVVRRIRANLGGNSWKHYWQNHFPPLHSGDIPGGPDLSLDMTSYFHVMWGGAAASWSAHTRISHLDSIWYGLKASILETYGH